jgi:hypothetical protein
LEVLDEERGEDKVELVLEGLDVVVGLATVAVKLVVGGSKAGQDLGELLNLVVFVGDDVLVGFLYLLQDRLMIEVGLGKELICLRVVLVFIV